MLRKLIPVLCLVMLTGVLACSDNEPVAIEKTVAPPPITYTVSTVAKLFKCILSGQADIYYDVNGSGWILLGSTSSTKCTTFPNITVNSGDVLRYRVVENSSGLDVAYQAGVNTLCAPSGTSYCDGTYFQQTITANTAVGLLISSGAPPGGCGTLGTCV